MLKYDYTNSKIDTKNQKRLHFYQVISSILEMYISTSAEVNELISWLSLLSNGYTDSKPNELELTNDEELKPDQKINDYTYIRNVTLSDFRIYCIIASIYENIGWNSDDVLKEITDKLYYLLDKIVHPYHKKNLDLEDIRFYVELEYISDEEKKELEEKYNIKFDTEEV